MSKRLFNEWKNSRKVSSFEELPIKFQEQLKEFIEIYKPITIWLFGSYANGDWITKDTPQRFVALKKRYKYKDKISDLDVFTDPPMSIQYKDVHISHPKHNIAWKSLIWEQS